MYVSIDYCLCILISPRCELNDRPVCVDLGIGLMMAKCHVLISFLCCALVNQCNCSTLALGNTLPRKHVMIHIR